VRLGEGPAVPLHLVGAEQFDTQRRLGERVFLGQIAAAQSCAQSEKGRANGGESGIQFRILFCSAISAVLARSSIRRVCGGSDPARRRRPARLLVFSRHATGRRRRRSLAEQAERAASVGEGRAGERFRPALPKPLRRSSGWSLGANAPGVCA